MAIGIATIAVGATAKPSRATEDRVASSVKEWVHVHRASIVDELQAFLRLPNVSRSVEDVRANADALVAMFETRGVETRLLPVDGGPPYVWARLPAQAPVEGASTPVVLFYGHFDGQPVDPERWTVTPPFEPTLRGDLDDPDSRIYARSASDDKAPIVALLAAIDALRALELPTSVEARFILDPEEEIGSPHLASVLERHADLLRADLMIFADGPVHQSGRPTVFFGTRGIVTVSLTLYGPVRALHSGHYGNWAPNPGEKLADLLASMKDPDGRVLIDGFYDDVVPLSPRELEALEGIPAVEDELRRELLVARPDGGGRSLQELINLPSLNVRGLASAWVGDEARTIVPSTATAEIDLRLVKDVRPEDQVERVRAHARARGYHVVDGEPDPETRRRHANVVRITSGHGVPASRTSMDLPVSRSLISAVERAVDGGLVLMPSLGGTGPLYRFEEQLGLPVYGIPIVNPDNNQHAPDENLRLGNLWKGIEIYASVLRMPPPRRP